MNAHTSFVRSRIAPILFAATVLFASAPALAIKPFTAEYQANYMGLQAQAQMTLASAGDGRWTYALNIRNPLAQLNQTTVFDEHDGKWRPLSGRDSSVLRVKRATTDATYDWAKGEARWSGDVKGDRAGPVPLQAGDLDAMLVNLAIVRDVQAGKPLDYRMVDSGRAKPMNYEVAGKDTVTFQGKAHAATKVTRSDGEKQTIVWVVPGVPVPARILQRKDGKDEMDLQLTSVQ
jgi:hypothetical protein